EDLVFLMLTGMTRAEHRQFGSTGIGGLGAPLLDQIGPGGEMPIPLDLRIYNEYSERAGTDTMRLSLGRSLTEDIWVAISSSVGQERDVKATLGYRISDSLSLSADYENIDETAIGNVGIDLRFRLEF
ncbi:MAG TPA: translocation/assembly module TamB domain-containing protein, partial [Polyangia bacterium]|nr:translocation/assembly module TamB domain-containing protein [Polyangia bacterium]